MFKEIKYLIQRGKRGYLDRDLWDLGYYISGVMVKAINDFDKTRHGYPSGLKDLEWSEILKDMKAGFQAILDMDSLLDWVEIENYKTEYKKLKAIKDKGLKLFVKYIEGLWD